MKKLILTTLKKFESTISSGIQAAQKELAAAIESGDAQAQVELTKELQHSLLRMQNWSKTTEGRQLTTQDEKPVNLSQGGNINLPQK